MSSRMLKKLHGENNLELDEQALSDDLETELSSAAVPVAGGVKKKQLNVNRYDLVSAREFYLRVWLIVTNTIYL